MSPQRTSAVIIVSGMAALFVWWQWPAAPSPNRIQLFDVHPPSAPEDTEAPPVVPPPPEPVEPPPTPVAATVPPPPAPPSAFDPQADLSTAIPDLIHLIQSGNFATLVQNYSPLPSGFSEEGLAALQVYMQTPQFKQEMQNLLAEMQFIENSPPIMSDNGLTTATVPPMRSPPVARLNRRFSSR